MFRKVMIIICLFIGSGFQAINDEIRWSKNSKLEWKDFIGIAHNHLEHGAISCTNAKIFFTMEDDSIIFTAYAIFNRSKSWYNKDYATNNALEHEQGHFDIAEYNSRKLKSVIQNSVLGKENYMTIINKSVEKNEKEIIDMQNLYDTQTDFSRDTIMQQNWNLRIEELLDSLKAFSEDLIIVKLK